jgi:hypothetical protein
MESSTPVLDADGAVLFICPRCGEPIGRDDFFELGMRLPDGESRDEYCDAELLEFVEHPRCARSPGASGH